MEKRATIIIAGYYDQRASSRTALWFDSKVQEVVNYTEYDFSYTLEEAEEEVKKCNEFIKNNEWICEAYVSEIEPVYSVYFWKENGFEKIIGPFWTIEEARKQANDVVNWPMEISDYSEMNSEIIVDGNCIEVIKEA